jgi:hypothetical protein
VSQNHHRTKFAIESQTKTEEKIGKGEKGKRVFKQKEKVRRLFQGVK